MRLPPTLNVLDSHGGFTADVEKVNADLAENELTWLKNHPEKVFLYIAMDHDPSPRTNPGYRVPLIRTARLTNTSSPSTVLDPHVELGPMREFPCFGSFPSRRRSVRAVIFGKVYVGWYFESSGDYCRLRLAKGQN